MAKTAAIVVAAGSGERLGLGQPKAFALVAGAPLLAHVVRALNAAETIDDIVVVVAEDRCEQARALLRRHGLVVGAVCPGGATRAASVRRGLEATPRRSQVVAVHDAARPLVSPALIDRTMRALVDPWAAVAPGLPLVDTLKLVDASRERVLRTVDRRGLWAVQTPQVFTRSTLQGVHARLEPVDATDDLSLVERAGGRVRVIEGERRNFKVTYPEDLVIAEALLARGS